MLLPLGPPGLRAAAGILLRMERNGAHRLPQVEEGDRPSGGPAAGEDSRVCAPKDDAPTRGRKERLVLAIGPGARQGATEDQVLPTAPAPQTPPSRFCARAVLLFADGR